MMEPKPRDGGSWDVTFDNAIETQEGAIYHAWSATGAAFILTFVFLQWEPWLSETSGEGALIK